MISSCVTSTPSITIVSVIEELTVMSFLILRSMLQAN